LGAFADAGAVTTNDVDVYEKIKKLRNYGAAVRYQHELQGVNSRIDELTAAFLRVKLSKLDEWNARRKHIAARYLSDLRPLISDLSPPKVAPWATSAWHLFAIRHPQRDLLQEKLSCAGVTTLIHYPIPPHLTDAYQSMGYNERSFWVAERVCNEILSLPIGPHCTPEQQFAVIDHVGDVA